MAIQLSPDCSNTRLGGSCGYCGKCGRAFKYVNRLDGQPILHIVAPSVNDSKDVKEICTANLLLTDLAPLFKVSSPQEVLE